ncbi:MAG: hypothetical protein QXK76_03875, partial [Candidatus Woesearchaeota archaeon]
CIGDNMIYNKNLWKVNIFIVITLFMIISVSINVNALGIAPSKTIINSEDIKDKDYLLKGYILNNDKKDMNIVIIPQGSYAEYIKLDNAYISINKNDKEKEFTYTISNEILKNLNPGENKIILLVAEIPSSAVSGGTKINSLLAVEHQIIINVPYPGIYAEGIFFINEANVNETIHFAVNVINKGTKDISNVNGELVIKGPTNEELLRLKSNTISIINSKNSGKLYVDYVANLNPGIYYAEFIVNYEDKQFVLRKTFTIGSVNAEIKDLRVEDFRIGYIAKVNIDVLNRWNLPINDAYAILQVIDKNGNIISETKTASSTLKQLTTTTLTGYWDSKGITTGIYDMKISLYYNNLVSEKVFDAAIGVDSVKVNNMASGMVTAKRESEKSNTLLYIIVFLLVIVNIFLVYVYFKYIRNKNQ